MKRQLSALLSVHAIDGVDAQRMAFREGFAALSELALAGRGAPFEGLSTDALFESVEAALELELFDDLSFLDAPAAACALYALAAALPLGSARRELGRRVLAYLHEGNASTFAALSSLLALGSGRAFEGLAVRARLSLCLALPAAESPGTDALALVLISRPDLVQRWVIVPSTEALPARRMAARLLERAAREAALRALSGDDGGVRLFESSFVQSAWSHLMSDREPLVWRHVAVARGFLAEAIPRFAQEIESETETASSYLRARRGATSLAASVAVRAEAALASLETFMKNPVFARDPGLSTALVFGVPRAFEVEPEAAERVLSLALRHGGNQTVETFLDARSEWAGSRFGTTAAQLALGGLRRRHPERSLDDGLNTLVDLMQEELTAVSAPPGSQLTERVNRALAAFSETGSRTAFELAREALACASDHVQVLEELASDESRAGRERAFRTLYELERGLLESSSLFDLCALGATSHEASGALLPFYELMRRLLAALLVLEGRPYEGTEEVPHFVLRMKRLRALLHALDADVDDDERREARDGRKAAVAALFVRIARDAPSAMDRVVHATVARGADHLVQNDVLELSDVVLAAAVHVPTPDGLSALADGSMLPDQRAAMKGLAGLSRTVLKAAEDPEGQSNVLKALFELSHALPASSAPRTEGLRLALLDLSRALQGIWGTRSLRELSVQRGLLAQLEHALDDLVGLTAGAKRRWGEDAGEATPTSGHGVWALGVALERAAMDGERTGLELTLETLSDSLRAELPPVLAAATMSPLRGLLARPTEAAGSAIVRAGREGRLPTWLPPSRKLGSYRLLAALGASAQPSVFLACLDHERHDRERTPYVVKVPKHDGRSARSLSEAEVSAWFREESVRLPSVAPHPNLARCFAAEPEATPKPLLAMEYVAGPSLERALAKGELGLHDGFEVLDGVMAGLEALHDAGLAYLDLRPANVILRERGGRIEPVLVDFGWSGRRLRPSCATAAYGAPEVWSGSRPGAAVTAVDIYAFGCMAAEILLGRPLFEAESESLIMSAHCQHDGFPPPVLALKEERRLATLAHFFEACLRQDPAERATASALRAALRDVKQSLHDLTVPLELPVGVAAKS